MVRGPIESSLTFIWDPEQQKWVAVGVTATRYRLDYTLPAIAQQIEGAQRYRKNGEEYLTIPKNQEKETVKLNPNFKVTESPTAKTIRETTESVTGAIMAPFAAYSRRREEYADKPLIEFLGLPKEGVAEDIREAVISRFGTEPVDINAPLPGPSAIAGAPGTAQTPSPMQDLLGGGRPTEPMGRGVPLRQVASPLSVPRGSLIPSEEDSELGLFEVNGQLALLLPDATGRSSSPIPITQFTTDLYNLPLDKVIQYQKAFGLKQTGRMDSALEAKIVARAKTTSIENYKRSDPMVSDKTQVSWEDAIISPQFGGGATGGGGVSVTAKQLKAAKDAIAISATQLGVALDDNTLNSLANAYARGDVNATVLPYEIVRQGTIDYTKGKAAETVNNLRNVANAYGVDYNEDWYKTTVANILSGKVAQETFDEQMRQDAKSRYPSLAAQIDAGYTVKAIASPYINAMSQILEINPESISLNDASIKRALMDVSTEGQPSVRPLWQFEQDLRKDDRWRYTKNAEQELMGTGINLLRKYGLVV